MSYDAHQSDVERTASSCQMLLTAVIWKQCSVASSEIERSGVRIANEDCHSPCPTVEVKPLFARGRQCKS